MPRLLASTLVLSLLALSAHAQDIPPTENLVLDGVPKIPLSLADAVGRYAEFRSAAFQSWHPTRREMLIRTRFGDTGQVHWVKAPGADRRQMTFFREQVGAASFPRHSDAYFVFTKDKGGDEFSQIFRYDLPSGDVTLLTDGGKSQNGIGPFSYAGDQMAYASTKRNGADRDIYVMDPKDPRTARLVLEVKGGGWEPVDWSRDGKTLLVAEELSVNESYLYLVDVASGARQALTPKAEGELVAYDSAAFAPDGKTVYATTDAGSEWMRLVAIDIASHERKVLSVGIDWDVEHFELSDDGRQIAFATNESGMSKLHLLDTRSGKTRALPDIGVGVVARIAWHSNNRDLAVTYTDAVNPADVYSIDVASGKVERWTESETGGISTAGFARAELVRFPSVGGQSISGFLYKPPARFTGKRPVIVNIHGGPESQSRPTFLGRSNYYLNELGVAFVYPNVRGSTGFGKSFVKLDNGKLREDSVADIGALLDWIRTRDDLDPDRVMIYGGSYGGYMTLASAVHYSDRVRCFVDVVGISNFVTFLEHTEAYRRDLRRVEYGDERDPAMREFLLSISPRTHAEKITKPLFVIQGKNDPRVPVAESEDMVATLKMNGTPVWYLMAKDEGHGFAKKKNADFELYSTVAFVQELLLK